VPLKLFLSFFHVLLDYSTQLQGNFGFQERPKWKKLIFPSVNPKPFVSLFFVQFVVKRSAVSSIFRKNQATVGQKMTVFSWL